MAIIKLTGISSLTEVIERSSEIPVFIFKHSTRCPVSDAANSEFSDFAESQSDGSTVLFAHLDLLRHRDVSDAIATDLAVRHQSPPAILVSDGRAVWNESHHRITVKSLSDAVNQCGCGSNN